MAAPLNVVSQLVSTVLGLVGTTRRLRHTLPSGLIIEQFPCLDTNYGYVLRGGDVTAAIDSPDATAIKTVCDENGWKLTHILNTHHHGDHVGGNLELKALYGCTVVGPEADRHRIPGIDVGVEAGSRFALGSIEVHVLDVKGHTTGQVAFYLPHEQVVFCGDALFVLGCGRLFEGTPAMAHESLCRLGRLPPETVVFCAHEYSQANARFALSVDPDHEPLKARAASIDAKRSEGLPTVPTTIGEELETNPFLRTASDAIRQKLGMPKEDDAEVFAELRRRKDRF